jgi:hypothetical protein
MGDFDESSILVVVRRLLLAIYELLENIKYATVQHTLAIGGLSKVDDVVNNLKSCSADI